MELVIEVLENLVTMQLRCVYGVRTKERTFQLILCMKVISCRGSNTTIKSQVCFLKISASNSLMLYKEGILIVITIEHGVTESIFGIQ